MFAGRPAHALSAGACKARPKEKLSSHSAEAAPTLCRDNHLGTRPFAQQRGLVEIGKCMDAAPSSLELPEQASCGVELVVG